MTDSSIPDVPAFADALTPLERAALGLQDELSVFEIALLTYPGDDKRARLLTGCLLTAIKAERLAAYGDPGGWDVQLAVDPLGAYEENPWQRCTPHTGTRTTKEIKPGFHSRYADMRWSGDNCLIRRVDYLAFLATPAAFGIPKPDRWKAPQGESDRPQQGAAAKHETESQMHRRECQELAKRLWAENPKLTQADLKKHSEMQFYIRAYRGKNTISNWLREIDLRPKEKRRGRPKKINV